MSNEMNQQPRKRGPMGRMGRGMQPGEKPKDLKKSIKQLAQYIGKYKIAIFIVMICAACSTVFNVAGPKILGKATTALSEGLMEKIRGTGSIDFARIGTILLFVLGLYLMSALFSFIQGWIMTGVTQKVCYQLRKEISEKINTYETSIQPFEDCCTIFVAKHPVTKPNIEVIRRSEEKLAEKIDEMMKTAIETAEIIEVQA